MVDRIRALMTWYQLTPTQFADAIQVGRPIISHILNGRNKASLDVVQRIGAALPEVALPWLLSGAGPMLTTTAEQTPGLAGPTAAPIAPLEGSSAATPVRAETKVATKVIRSPPPHPPISPANTPLASSIPVPELAAQQNNNLLTTKRISESNQPSQKFLVKSLPNLTSPVLENAAGNGAAKVAPLPVISTFGLAEPVSELKPAIATDDEGGKDNTSTCITAEVVTLPPSENSSHPELVTTPPGPAKANQEDTKLTANKPIRRIVIFYRDGSFTDFQPES